MLYMYLVIYNVLQELNAQISALQKQVDDTEVFLRDERNAHGMSIEELEAMKSQVICIL